MFLAFPEEKKKKERQEDDAKGAKLVTERTPGPQALNRERRVCYRGA